VRTREIILIEIIIFTALWLYDEYVAFILSIIIPSILFAILLVSLILELIEKSNVPRSYFKTMFLAVIPPIIIAALYIYNSGGQMDWLVE